MNTVWGVATVYVVVNLQYADCQLKEAIPPPLLRCWTCSRRIASDAETDHYCIQGNFKNDIEKYKRQARLCLPRQHCMVKYKISGNGAKTISRLCSDDYTNLCRTESTPYSNSTVCYRSCDQNLCNSEPASTIQGTLTTDRIPLTTAVLDIITRQPRPTTQGLAPITPTPTTEGEDSPNSIPAQTNAIATTSGYQRFDDWTITYWAVGLFHFASFFASNVFN